MVEEIWNIANKWDYFTKDSIGKQLVRSADSIATNLSEGFERFFYKEEKLFCYYSRGSLYETSTRLTKAYNRKLIDDEGYKRFTQKINNIGVKLNNYINSIGKRNSIIYKIPPNDN